VGVGATALYFLPSCSISFVNLFHIDSI